MRVHRLHNRSFSVHKLIYSNKDPNPHSCAVLSPCVQPFSRDAWGLSKGEPMLLTNSGLFFAASNIPAVRELLMALVSKRSLDYAKFDKFNEFWCIFFCVRKKKRCFFDPDLCFVQSCSRPEDNYILALGKSASFSRNTCSCLN